MKYHYSTLTPRQIDWCFVDALGLPRSKTPPASHGFLHRRKLPFKLWEAIPGSAADLLSYASSPITVTRYGPLAEGEEPTLTFVDAKGLERTGRAEEFFLSSHEAHEAAIGLTLGYAAGFHPSTCAEQGRFARDIMITGNDKAEFYRLPGPTSMWECRLTYSRMLVSAFGETDLIAFGRAYVRAAMGEEVEVPDEPENL